MARGPTVDIRAHLLHGFAHHEARYSAGKLDTFQAALERSASFFASFAIFFGHECNQFVGMLLHQLVEVKEHTAAIEDRGRAPRRECSLRGCNGSRHFLARAQRNLRHWLARRGIVLDKSLAARVLRPAIDVNWTRLELSSDGAAGHERPQNSARKC